MTASDPAEERTCSVPGCLRKYRARGYCATHYWRWQKFGTHELPPKPERAPVCSVSGCDKPTLRGNSGNELCAGHYGRKWKNGDPGEAYLQPRRRTPKQCIANGCTTVCKSASGYCAKHKTRIERHGDPYVYIEVQDRNLPKGPGSPKWTGDDATYGAAHQRVRRARGSASKYDCVDCGKKAQHWSYSHHSKDERQSRFGPYGIDISDYDPRCVKCHKKLDLEMIRRKNALHKEAA